MIWTTAAPAIVTAFVSSLVEAVEAAHYRASGRDRPRVAPGRPWSNHRARFLAAIVSRFDLLDAGLPSGHARKIWHDRPSVLSS